MADFSSLNGYKVKDPIARENITRIDNNIIDINAQVRGLASGSPLVASSTSEMTDTTKIYVNTTDGKWYYYDGDSWEIGGTYQTSGIDNGAIDKYTLENNLANDIYKTVGTDIRKGNDIQNIIKNAQSDTFVTVSGVSSLIVPIEHNTKYIVKKGVSSRFALYLSEDYPETGVAINDYVADSIASELEITSGASDNYLTIFFHNSSAESRTVESVYNTIKVYKTEVVDGVSYGEYLEEQIDDDILFNEKYVKLLSYRALGTLQKGYIAISSDDGNNSLADITVDIFKGYKTTYGKNIPLTMGLASNSAIFSDETRKAKVLDLINNYGSSVAIHGSTEYTNYTRSNLFNFLDTQKEYLTNNLVAPTSIIYPSHSYNDSVSAVAGSYYGVCCTGGVNYPITYNGNSKLAGPRSNMYTLYRFSLFNDQTTKAKIKNAIDYAYDNNMIFLPFFHDNGLSSDYERNKELLDYCVEYANEKGLEFINVGDIPTII